MVRILSFHSAASMFEVFVVTKVSQADKTCINTDSIFHTFADKTVEGVCFCNSVSFLLLLCRMNHER